jgi:hypothetical protein
MSCHLLQRSPPERQALMEAVARLRREAGNPLHRADGTGTHYRWGGMMMMMMMIMMLVLLLLMMTSTLKLL